MKEITWSDLLMGTNDSMHVLHEISKHAAAYRNLEKSPDDGLSKSVNEGLKQTIGDFINSTEDKRRWSILIPGLLMAQSYMYFVVGHEAGLLKGLEIKGNGIFIFKNDELQLKSGETEDSGILRHLRNAIAHARYKFYITNPNGDIENFGDISIEFKDFVPNDNDPNDESKYYCEFHTTFSDFGNFIETAGKMAYIKAESKQY